MLNWAQHVENTTEYAHWLLLIQVILIIISSMPEQTGEKLIIYNFP